MRVEQLLGRDFVQLKAAGCDSHNQLIREESNDVTWLQCQHYCDVSERVLAACAMGRVLKKLALQLDLATGHIFNVGIYGTRAVVSCHKSREALLANIK